MKKFLLFLVVGTLLRPAFNAIGQEAEAPVYKEGECWLFKSVSKNYQSSESGVRALPENGEHKICFLEGKFFEVEGDAKSELLNDSVWNNILYIQENRFLKFPLIVGQKRTEQFQHRVRGTLRLRRVAFESIILGVQNIALSADTYRSFKIEKTNWCDRLCDRWIYFYSPQTKSVIKYNYEATAFTSATREVELIRFWPVP